MTKGIPAYWALAIWYFREPFHDTMLMKGMATASTPAAVAIVIAAVAAVVRRPSNLVIWAVMLQTNNARSRNFRTPTSRCGCCCCRWQPQSPLVIIVVIVVVFPTER